MPALLVVSASRSAQRDILKEILDELIKKDFTLTNKTDGGEWESILPSLLTPGLFEGKSIWLVEDAEKMGAMPDRFSALVEPLVSARSVLLLAYEGSPSKFLSKEILRSARVVKETRPPRWESEKKQMLKQFAIDMDVHITPGGLSLMVELFQDPSELKNELSKLAFVAERKDISEDEVRKYCLDEGTSSLYRFLEGVCERDIPLVVDSLRRLELNQTELLYVLTALYNKLRLASYLCIYGSAFSQILVNSLGIKPFQLNQAKRILKKYPPALIISTALKSLAMSYSEKSRYPKGWRGFEVLILKFLKSGDR